MNTLVERALELATARAQREAKSELRARGVVATPGEVARCAVENLDALLRNELGVAEGLASERVLVVDPAVGTGVWLAALLELTQSRVGAARRVLAFDVDATSLESARALLDTEAARQGVALELACANTLERELPRADDRVLVVLGNPPWAARSLSRGGASDALLREFYRDGDGEPLRERRGGVLSDDYVRFFAWAIREARASERGAVVCFATNNSFVDGPVHRGMRAALARAFDRIDVLDLGGNALLAREGADENVFGVRVGAALTWAVRRPGERREVASVRYVRLSGRRADKLRALASAPRYAVHTPSAPWFWLRPQPPSLAREASFSLAEAMPFHREGVQTNRDAFATAASRDELEERAVAFARGRTSLAASRHFDPESARASLAAARERGPLPIESFAYRPLDERYLLALAPLCHRPRSELALAVRHSDVCLLTVRKDRGSSPYNFFAPVTKLADACFLSVRSSCRTRVFPARDPRGAENLEPAFRARFEARVQRELSGRALALYALGVLACARFRAAHEDALKLDYPRLPWPEDGAAFARRVALGERLLTALTGQASDPAPCRVHVDAETSIVQPLAFDAARGRVSSAGCLLLSEVSPAHFGATVGHHSLVASALRASARPTVAQLLTGLSCAARWAGAVAAASAVDSAGVSA